MQLAQVDLAIVGARLHLSQGDAELGREQPGHRFGERIRRGLLELIGVLDHLPDRAEYLLVIEPILETALLPSRQVRLIDGLVSELGLHFRQRVEPRDEVHAGLAVEEALIELPADDSGQAGDFSVAIGWCHGRDAEVKSSELRIKSCGVQGA